jgi:dUTP pyrophosphatase
MMESPQNIHSVKIYSKGGAEYLPQKKSEFASGYDVQAYLPETPIKMKSGDRALVSTGLFLEIPAGMEIQVRPRSGLAMKHGITVLNSPGTIDSDYRGELKVLLINLGRDDFAIRDKMRIAQLIFCRVETIEWNSVRELTELESSSRARGGFGHTGI